MLTEIFKVLNLNKTMVPPRATKKFSEQSQRSQVLYNVNLSLSQENVKNILPTKNLTSF